MKYLLIFLSLVFGNSVYGYDGPKTAGIEYYHKGIYQIKGYIKCPTSKNCFLFPYYKTSRQYSIKLRGIMAEKSNINEGHYEVRGKVYRDSLGDRLELYVFDYPHHISEISALKYTVTKLD